MKKMIFKKDIPKMFIRTEYVHYPLTFQEIYNKYMNQITHNVDLAVKPLLKIRQFHIYKDTLMKHKFVGEINGPCCVCGKRRICHE